MALKSETSGPFLLPSDQVDSDTSSIWCVCPGDTLLGALGHLTLTQMGLEGRLQPSLVTLGGRSAMETAQGERLDSERKDGGGG